MGNRKKTATTDNIDAIPEHSTLARAPHIAFLHRLASEQERVQSGKLSEAADFELSLERKEVKIQGRGKRRHQDGRKSVRKAQSCEKI